MIIEVLSPWSEKDDTGRKLALYLKIPSLHHYLMIDQERRQIVHHQRRDDLGDAFLTTIAPPDPLRLDPPGIEISLAAIYDGVPVTAVQPGQLQRSFPLAAITRRGLDRGSYRLVQGGLTYRGRIRA